jgi:hypothetical protein
VTARPPSPSAQVSALLSRFSPEIVALAKRGLTTLRRAFPGSIQLVYDYRDSVVVAFGMSERGSDAVVSIAVSSRGVRLYFRKDLPDPAGRLEGGGSQVRSVPVHAASDLDHEDVRALLQAAIQHSGLTFRRGRSTRMVIKSASRKR